MEIIPFYIIYMVSNLFNLYVTSRYVRLFLEERIVKHSVLSVVYFCSFFVGTLQYLFFPIPILNLIVSISFIVLIVRCYENKIQKIITVSLLIWMFQFLAEAIVAMIIGIGNVTIAAEHYNFDSFQIISVQIISVIIYKIISMFKNIGKDVLIPTTFNIGSLSLCIVSFILEIEIFMQQNIKQNIKMLSVICMILILFIIIYLYDLISKSYIEKMQAKMIEREKTYYYQQAELMQQSDSDLKKFRHDINNHLYVLNSMIKEDNKEAKKYLEELTGKLKETFVYSNSGNIALDSIINYKLSEAKSKDIKVSSSIVLPENLNAEMEDMVTIFGNILDNALEATEKIQKDKYMNLSVKYKVGTLFITLINSYDGNIIHRNGKLQTRKSDDTIHGIGVKSVEATVNKYNGIVKINYDEKEFRVKIMLYV